jgi:hypothetical protein
MSKRDMGLDELNTLKEMWKRWLHRDVVWAAEVVVAQGGQTHKEDEWAFLEGEWKEDFYMWMYPYVRRLYETEYITEDDAGEFVGFAYTLMDTALDAIRLLEVPEYEES